MPKITSGGIISAQTKYPSHSGNPSPRFRPWAMIEPSRAKKMKVKLA